MTNVRSSNMELLRIVAMFLILGIHALGLAHGGLPSVKYTQDTPLGTLFFFFSYGACCVGVNVFVLISGWFGIRFKWQSLCKLIFQVLFFTVIIFVILALVDSQRYLTLDAFSYVFLIPSSQLWFVKAYVLLMLFSPVLNSFVEHASQRQILFVLAGFYLFQSIYGWLFMNSTPWIGGGYSPVSFMGLYLLARYLRIYPQRWCSWPFSRLMGFFVILMLALAFVSTAITYLNHPIAGRLYAYSSPFAILGAVLLLVAFSRIQLQYHWINWVAASAFAVYLTHGHEIVLRHFYGPFVGRLYREFGGCPYVIMVLLFIVGVFVVSILIDKVREWLWLSTQ